MTITIVCDVLGKENNGTTIAAMNLIRYLKSQGHTIRVLCGDADKKGQEGFFVVPNYNLGKLLNGYVKKIGVTLAKPDKDVVQKALDGVDLVHIMVPLALGMFALKVARQKGIPVTAGFHMQAENLTCYLKLNKMHLINHAVYKFIYNKFYKYVDAVHYPTKFIKDVFFSHVKKETNAYVISNGVNAYVQKRDVEKPDELNDKIVLLMIGRFAREKSQDTLLKAVKYSKHKDKIQIILAGQGPKEKYYKKLGKKLPNKPILSLFGRQDVIDVINYSDMYVHTAEAELEGIACLEAICCGKLTLVSDSKLSATKGFAVDKRCVFRNRNPKDLAKKIDYFINHEEEKRELEQVYLNSAKIYSLKECMQKMEQMMIDVFNARKLEIQTQE